MQPGKALDSKIFLKITNQKIDDPYAIPDYSTNEFHSYAVISKLQNMGWSCNLKSHIAVDGSLSYKVAFHKDNKQTSYRYSTIPMAVCMAAMSVFDNQYFEYVETENKPNDEIGAEIINIYNSEIINQPNNSLIVDDKNYEDLIINVITETIRDSIFITENNKKIKFHGLLKNLQNQNVITEDFGNKIPIRLAELIVDKLNSEGIMMKKQHKSDN